MDVGGLSSLTAVTGALMFITNAAVYFHNTYFRAKVVLLVLAALNTLVFELTARRTVAAVGRGAARRRRSRGRSRRCRWSSGSASSSPAA